MSVYDVSGNTINSFYDANGATKSDLYDVDGNLITSQEEFVFLDNTILTTVYTNPSLNQVSQGGCIGADSNVYVVFHDAGIIENYNLKTEAEKQYTFTGGAYGHANGMTFNPNTGYLYIAAMKGTGEVYVLEPSTMELVDTVYAKDGNGTAFSCWNIAYDRLTRQFLTISGLNLHFYNDSFQYVKTLQHEFTADYVGTRQDIETDGHYIYCVTDLPMNIHVLHMDGTYVKCISNSGFVGEPESLMYNWETGLFYLETFPLKIVLTEFIQRR